MEKQTLDDILDLHELIETLQTAKWTDAEIHALKQDIEKWCRGETVTI